MSGKRIAAWAWIGLLLPAALAGYMVSSLLAGSAAPALASGTRLPEPRPVAAFQLTDHLGAPFGNAELAGRPSLLFFGFTHCPDVCPTTLATLARLKRQAKIGPLRVIFVTVDPARDDARALRQYVDAFGGAITGLRGEDAMLEPLLANLGVARSIQPLPGGDYTVDHSAALYYLDAQGRFAAVFTPPFEPGHLAADLAALVNSD